MRVKRKLRVEAAPRVQETPYVLHDVAAGCVAQIHLVDGYCWVYIRKVGRKQVSYVPLRWHATTDKISTDEWEERVIDATVHPATDYELERFKRVTSAWRESAAT